MLSTRPTLRIVLLILCFSLLLPVFSGAASPRLQEARVIAVNDGDTITIRMDGQVRRTRLIGIDAPEMGQEPWGRRSREYLRKLLKELDWNVLIETDVQAHDKYGRLLVYVRNRNNDMINERMLLDGYAVLFTIQPNSRYADRFVKAQRAARDARSGIWGPEGLKESPRSYKRAHPHR